MAEDFLDDSELVADESLAGVDYEEIDNVDRPAEGDHLVLIKKVKARKVDRPNIATYKEASVQLQIVEGPDKGKLVFDSIPLPHPGEDDWMRKKRLIIAKRVGFIAKDSSSTVSVNWKRLEGMTVIVELGNNDYTSTKTGKLVKGIRPNTFHSYRDPATEPSTGSASTTASSAAKPSEYNDI